MVWVLPGGASGTSGVRLRLEVGERVYAALLQVEATRSPVVAPAGMVRKVALHLQVAQEVASKGLPAGQDHSDAK